MFHYMIIWKQGQYLLASSKRDALLTCPADAVVVRYSDSQLEKFIESQIS